MAVSIQPTYHQPGKPCRWSGTRKGDEKHSHAMAKCAIWIVVKTHLGRKLCPQRRGALKEGCEWFPFAIVLKLWCPAKLLNNFNYHLISYLKFCLFPKRPTI